MRDSPLELANGCSDGRDNINRGTRSWSHGLRCKLKENEDCRRGRPRLKRASAVKEYFDPLDDFPEFRSSAKFGKFHRSFSGLITRKFKAREEEAVAAMDDLYDEQVVPRLCAYLKLTSFAQVW